MEYGVEIVSCGMIYLYIPSFMEIDIGIQAILRFNFRNLKGCNIVLLMGRLYELRH
jgi:hypothetical protein